MSTRMRGTLDRRDDEGNRGRKEGREGKKDWTKDAEQEASGSS